MKLNIGYLWVVILLAVSLAGCSNSTMPYAEIPAGSAFAEGQEIYFIHTEVSDPEVAKLLTDMMKSPVLYVPQLSRVPEESLANVYVFNNGLKGMGPFGYQADVFDNPPGTEGYSPLRRLSIVSWKDPARARLLQSTAAILEAEKSGEVTIQKPGVIINMPFVTWQGGKR